MFGAQHVLCLNILNLAIAMQKNSKTTKAARKYSLENFINNMRNIQLFSFFLHQLSNFNG